jgi:3-dehydroquinate synthase
MSFRFRVEAHRAGSWATTVVVAPGALEQAAIAIAREFRGAQKVIVSDARVASLHGRRFVRLLAVRGAAATLLTFPPGERAKTRETKARLEDRLFALGAGRDTVVVALGGGVTGDLAGFLAATWNRGVPVVSIPTSLLAMVDAGLGGKTAVDLPGGKNVVGAFHQPVSLWADVRVLRTLPGRTYRAGFAEAVKTAATLDAGLFRQLEASVMRLLRRDTLAVATMVARCLELKGRVVARDEREAGRRAVLNFGHTAAHAIEAATDYRVPHGEAVSMGITAEARLAERLTGLPSQHAERIESLLRAFGLPVRPPRGLDRKRLVTAIVRDKKTRGRIVRCALPVGLGRMVPGADPTVSVDPTRDLLPLLVRN